MQNFAKIPNIGFLEAFEDKMPNANYIMQGRAKEKALDVYHLIIAPTYACNLRCRHCYLPNHNQDILPKDIVLRLIDEWNRIVLEERGRYGGIFHIKGGEPFVVPYLWDIIDKLVKLQSLRLMLTTNGTFTKEDIFKRLSDCRDALDGYLTIIVSLDGATEETHAILRGKGQFVKTLKFLNGLQKYGISFYLNCVLHKGNINELSAYINLANEYGATQINFLNFIPRGNGSTLRNWQLPHLELYERLEELYRNGNEQTKKMLAGSLPDIKCREIYYCSTSRECVAGYRGLLYITPNGSTFTCPNVVYPNTSLGNVFNQNLKGIMWNVEELYNRLKVYSGIYLCTGERMLYEMEKDMFRLKSLRALQTYLDKSYLNHILKPLSISYCFNRNW